MKFWLELFIEFLILTSMGAPMRWANSCSSNPLIGKLGPGFTLQTSKENMSLSQFRGGDATILFFGRHGVRRDELGAGKRMEEFTKGIKIANRPGRIQVGLVLFGKFKISYPVFMDETSQVASIIISSVQSILLIDKDGNRLWDTICR